MVRRVKHQVDLLLRGIVILLGLLAVISLASPADAERQPADQQLEEEPPVTVLPETDTAVQPAADEAADETPGDANLLSPYWGPNIQQWSDYIAILADAYGFHPDFIAAVIKHESDGDYQVVSRMGAVGLMGIMPAGPGLEWRPSPEELLTPTVNLRWGMAILSTIVRQSGGDVYAALAAYNGGWDQVNSRGPRDYAADVLDSYARAVLVRYGISPDMATQWTIAIEMVAGHVSSQSLLVLGNQPLAELRTLAPHTVYRYADEKSGQTYYIRGYAVPVTPLAAQTENVGLFDTEVAPFAQPGEKGEKAPNSDPRVVLACLPSLDRLRGHASTRWYAPSSCPSWHR